jgi:hypothetical protein
MKKNHFSGLYSLSFGYSWIHTDSKQSSLEKIVKLKNKPERSRKRNTLHLLYYYRVTFLFQFFLIISIFLCKKLPQRKILRAPNRDQINDHTLE